MEKVTDPKKVTTDPVLLKELKRQNIDKDYVELHKDYSKEHPFAKVYKDLKSNKMFQVISGLPKVRKIDGVKIEAGWTQYGEKFITKPNLFTGIVESTQVEITALNDQPNGTKEGDSVMWNPQLFIDGSLQIPSIPYLLPVDPINENYQNNTIEWDYGVCKRRLRIIEGRIREKWIFTENPDGEIRIQHNQSGKIKLRFGSGIDADGKRLQIEVENDDEEVLKDHEALFPVEIGASPETFYPDAHEESTSVDGLAWHYTLNAVWADIQGGIGNGSNDTATGMDILKIKAGTVTDRWELIRRSIYLFNTASLPNGAIIIDAVLSIRGVDKSDGLSANPTLNVYSSNPASNTAVVNGDFNSLDTVAFASNISYASYITDDYNNFTLNASGIAAIDKEGVSKFGLRESTYDVLNTPPDWVNGADFAFGGWYAEQGAGYKPKFVVTYTVDINESISVTLEMEANNPLNLTKSIRPRVETLSNLGEQLITNRGMELDSDWEDYNANGTKVRSNEQAHNGTYSWKITLNASGNYTGIKQNITGLVIGKTYKISAWFYNLDMTDGERLELDCTNFVSGSIGVAYWDIFPTNGIWVKNGDHVFVANATSGYLMIYNFPTDVAEANKSFYVDDVSIREIIGIRALTFPIQPLVEIEAATPKSLTFPIIPLVEIEAAVTSRLGLKKSVDALVEMEASLVKIGLEKSLSARLEMVARLNGVVSGEAIPIAVPEIVQKTSGITVLIERDSEITVLIDEVSGIA